MSESPTVRGTKPPGGAPQGGLARGGIAGSRDGRRGPALRRRRSRVLLARALRRRGEGHDPRSGRARSRKSPHRSTWSISAVLSWSTRPWPEVPCCRMTAFAGSAEAVAGHFPPIERRTPPWGSSIRVGHRSSNAPPHTRVAAARLRVGDGRQPWIEPKRRVHRHVGGRHRHVETRQPSAGVEQRGALGDLLPTVSQSIAECHSGALDGASGVSVGVGDSLPNLRTV